MHSFLNVHLLRTDSGPGTVLCSGDTMVIRDRNSSSPCGAYGTWTRWRGIIYSYEKSTKGQFGYYESLVRGSQRASQRNLPLNQGLKGQMGVNWAKRKGKTVPQRGSSKVDVSVAQGAWWVWGASVESKGRGWECLAGQGVQAFAGCEGFWTLYWEQRVLWKDLNPQVI